SQLQSQHGGAAGHAAVAHADIANRRRLAAAGDEPVAIAALDFFDHDVFHGRAVLIPIGERALAALQRDVVVVGGDVAAADRDVLRAVHVDAVGAGRAHVEFGGAGNRDAQIFDEDVATAVQMQVPETGIFQRNLGYPHIATAIDKNEPRAFHFEV